MSNIKLSENLFQGFENFPRELPLLAVQGAVLLPRSQLPLPVYDLDHLQMLIESLKTHKMIGVVQPFSNPDKTDEISPIFKTGCLGKVVDLHEVEEQSFIVTLKGVCRFKVIEEIFDHEGYRRANVCYDDYLLDCVEDSDFAFDRSRLLKALEQYFKIVDITPNWQEISKTSNEKLIAALTMVCPLEAREKQALLEAPTPQEQSQLMTAFIELASHETVSTTCH